jgi:hypothetical protein
MKIKINYKRGLETTFISYYFDNITNRIRIRNDDLRFLELGLYGFITSYLNCKNYTLIKSFGKRNFEILTK